MRLVIDLQGAQGHSYTRGMGRYSRELALAMARGSREHEVIVALNGALPDTADLLIDSFSSVLPRCQIKVWSSPREVGELIPHEARRGAAEHLRAQFLASLAPDLVHVSSLFDGLGNDIVTHHPPGLERLPYVATCYDLIPLIRHEHYFGGNDGKSPPQRWYYRRLRDMLLCEGLLAISESSRQEAIRYLNFPKHRVFNLGAGISPRFRPIQLSSEERQALLGRYGLRGDFILFLGAGDIRKNEAGLVAAYGLLPATVRARIQLLIVGPTKQDLLREAAMRAGILEAEMVVVPFVAEGDLSALYSTCHLFVFPSLHEGFGLPVAEAMACGAPVIAGNNSSLPEVVGRNDALFDATRPEAIAALMRSVLENHELRRSLAEYGPRRAANFTWEACALRAWDGLEAIHEQRAAPSGPRVHTVLRPLQRLAHVSPLPPQPSGIADYSRDLTIALSRYYDVTLVSEVEEVGEIRLAANFAVLSPAEFLRVADTFDRVVYQVGNSAFHHFQVEGLLPARPGIIDLHGGFLSDYRDWLARTRGNPPAFLHDLYLSHGYPALCFVAERGRAAALVRFPCTLPVVRGALGVIQHSRHATELLAEHYGEAIRQRARIIPRMRSRRPLPERSVARQRLGIDRDEYLVCSFGQIAAGKLPGRILQAWGAFQASLGHGAARLVFVGEASPDVAMMLESAAVANQPHLTGRVDQDTYDDWLAAADVAVQLRRNSRGESSGAIGDCLAAGLAVIVNAHGAASELPAGSVLSLPDCFDDADLVRAIALLHGDLEERRRLGAAGIAYAQAVLDPGIVASQYHDAIEEAYRIGAATTHVAMLATIAAAEDWQQPGTEDRIAVAKAISGSLPLPSPPQLLVDISEFARGDSHSDTHRVVREVCRYALKMPPRSFRTEAVCFQQGVLCSAHRAALDLLHLDDMDLAEHPVDAAAGDILLCLDPNLEMGKDGFAELRRLRQRGVRVVVVFYDMIPLQQPKLYPESVVDKLRDWHLGMLACADDAMCVSRAVADELRTLLDGNAVPRSRLLPVGWFRLGAKLDYLEQEPTPSAGIAAGKRPNFLVIGTVEPRKGYRQIIEAFDALWAAGHDVGLTILGRPGWKSGQLSAQLSEHKEAGHRLQWLHWASDAERWSLYGGAAALIVASEAEGFSLPLLEAARGSLPAIARDIPVLREIASDGTHYFSGTEGSALADAIVAWLDRWKRGTIARPDGVRVSSWEESTRGLLQAIVHERYYYIWRPATSSDASR